jgi:transposase-like protein
MMPPGGCVPVYANPSCQPPARATASAAFRMLLPSQQGWPTSQIAGLLGYDPSTVRRWIRGYRRHGPSGRAAGRHRYRPARLAAGG